MKIASLFFVLAACVAYCSPAKADDRRAENPVYKNWQRFPVGSTVVYEMTTEAGAFREKRVMTYRLKAKDDVKLTVEMTSELIGQQKAPIQSQELTNQRYFELPDGVLKENFGKSKGHISEGLEEIEFSGKKFNTEWSITRNKVEAGETETKTWSSLDVPGKLVKSISTTAATKSTTTISLVKITIPDSK